MAPAPHRVYSQELSAAFRRGHPIAHPQPVEYQTGNSDGAGGVRRPVEIGDVGYIQPEHGYFIRLFNVHLEPGVDGQPTRNRLPDDFEVLPKDEITKVTDNTPIFLSRTVTTKNLTAAASGPFFGGSVEFSATSKRGAILATPDPIECTDAICIPIYMNHARAHIQSWYEFFSQRHLIELEDLILVTGVDHTTSWATAVIADTELEAGFGLNVQFATAGAGIQLACQYSWQSTFGALVNSGPPRGSDAIPETPTSTSLASPSYRLGIDADDGDASLQPLNSRNDQSLFVRHIRAKRRSRWLGMKLAAAGESDDTDDKGDDTDPDSCTDAIETGKEVLFVATSPGREDFVDCLEPVLDYILEHSDSDIALAHDNDIEILLATASSSNPIVNIQAGVGTSFLSRSDCAVVCVVALNQRLSRSDFCVRHVD
ncbi:hypothetical protein PENSPDRAFT_368623 [Peniophora sp. CONT]|nr:hypothetical protein PENSPDRAFT_368623 [Peniophora sp. CONT]